MNGGLDRDGDGNDDMVGEADHGCGEERHPRNFPELPSLFGIPTLYSTACIPVPFNVHLDMLISHLST